MTEKGSRSSHVFPVGNEKVAERQRQRGTTHHGVTVAGKAGWTGDPVLPIESGPRLVEWLAKRCCFLLDWLL